MSGDEVPREEKGDAGGAPQTERSLRDELRHRLLPNDAKNQQAGGDHKGIDDERMREDVRSEWPPFAQQAEAKPDDANRAVPIA